MPLRYPASGPLSGPKGLAWAAVRAVEGIFVHSDGSPERSKAYSSITKGAKAHSFIPTMNQCVLDPKLMNQDALDPKSVPSLTAPTNDRNQLFVHHIFAIIDR